MAALAIENLKSGYGELQIVRGADLIVEEGEAVSMIGRNGGGKTTLLRSIFGLTTVRSGLITIANESVRGYPRWKMSRLLRVSYVTDNRSVFSSLIVRDNLKLARIDIEDGYTVDDAFDWFPQLRKLLSVKAENLSGGEQQMLALAMAIMKKPKLLVIDEFSQGLQPRVIESFLGTLRDIRSKTRMSMLVVEQSVSTALALSDRLYVMDRGTIVFEGDCTTISSNLELIKPYLSL